MTDRPDDNASTKNEPKPAPSGPPNLLDSIFRDGGPLPPAKLGIRSLAFLMDFILLFILGSVIIWQFALPRAYPGALTEYTEGAQEWVTNLQEHIEQGHSPKDMELPTFSPYVNEAILFGWEVMLLVFWIYFAVGETLFKGSSLGKKACRLRTISTVTLGPPPIFAGIVRGGSKTLILFFYFPFGLLLALGALFFNKRRQMAHDLFSRTAVVDEKSVNLPNPR